MKHVNVTPAFETTLIAHPTSRRGFVAGLLGGAVLATTGLRASAAVPARPEPSGRVKSQLPVAADEDGFENLSDPGWC